MAHIDARVILTARRLPDRQPLQEGEHDTRDSDDQKRRPPTPMQGDVSAERATDQCAQGDREAVDGHGGSSLLAREVVCDDGSRGRSSGRFTHSYTNSCEHQVREVASEPRHRGG